MQMWTGIFCGGVVLGVWLGPAWSAISPWWVPPGLVAMLCLPVNGWRRRAMAGLCGYLFAMLALGDALSHRLPEARSGETRELTGRVIGLPEVLDASRGGRRQRFELRVLAPASELRRVSLSWHEPGRLLRPGERVRLRARLFTPRARLNQGGFDRARHDLAAGRDAHGYVTALLGRSGTGGGLDALRDRLSDRLRGHLAPWPVAARWLPALVTGDRRHLTAADWRLLRRSGTVHLMAISGLHITLVAGLVWWLFRWLPAPLWRRRSPVAAQQLAVLPALAAAAGYACLAGFSLPTQRALIMTSLVFLALLSGRRRTPGWYLGMAMVGVLLWHPLAPLAPGFWLSFGAVALLLLVVSGGGRGLVRAQMMLALGLGAISAWLFGDWGALAPLANLILIPLFSFLVVPLALAATLLDWPLLLTVLGPVMEVIHAGLARFVPLAPTLPVPAGVIAALCLLAAVAILAAPGTLLPRWVAPFLLLPGLLVRTPAPEPGHFRLVVFDVGQGQALAIRTRNAIVLYDLGPSWAGGDTGERLLRPWLARQGVPPVLAFASHGDNDHAGGWPGVASLLPPGRLFSGEPRRLGDASPCLRGQRWVLDGVRFEVLWPVAGLAGAESNNRSCVIRVTGSGGTVLLTGDIEKPAEYWLSRNEDLSAELLQLPHHGSASSSSFTLLNAVRPQRAFASSGHLNAFGHPSPAVRRRLRDRGVALDVTAETGMIVFRIDGQHNAAPERWRETRYRPWRAMIE